MGKSMKPQSFLERLLLKTGIYYIVIAAVFAQITASISTLLGFTSEQLNADYSPELVVLLRHFYY